MIWGRWVNVAVCSLAAHLFVAPATAQEIRVIDGDTFELDGEVIRLWRIDAPELGQTCERDGEVVRVGELAADELRNTLVPGLPCLQVDTDQYGRTIARRYGVSGGIDTEGDGLTLATDLGLVLVLSGHAWDWPEYSDGTYQGAQENAQANGFGVWQEGMDCIPPWEWREGSRDR